MSTARGRGAGWAGGPVPTPRHPGGEGSPGARAQTRPRARRPRAPWPRRADGVSSLSPARAREAVILRAREAAQFLRPRQRRAYQVFEEAKQGHLERECIEELCSQEEAREVFENDPETVSARAGEVCARRLGPRGGAGQPGPLERRPCGAAFPGTPSVRARLGASASAASPSAAGHIQTLIRGAIGAAEGQGLRRRDPGPPSRLLLPRPSSAGDARCRLSWRGVADVGGRSCGRPAVLFPRQACESSRFERTVQ